MKKIGIIFAMSEELEQTKKLFDNVKVHSLYDLNVFECITDTSVCYLVLSGIGKVNAARTTQIIIDNMKVDYILNVGVAGSISKEVNICDIVIAKSLVQHDFDLTVFNREKGEIPNVGKYINCDKRLIELSRNIKVDTNLYYGIVASGDIFIADEKMGQEIKEKFDALCVDMESSSIAQVCHLCNVPFLVIRSISDSPYEKNNHLTYNDVLKISSNVVAKFTYKLLNKI